MTIDTAAITEGITTFINDALGYLPLGLAIFGIPAGLVLGLRFGGSLIKMVQGAFGSLGSK
jgi:hypothetical protein